MSPDGKWFATGNWKGTGVVIWRAETLKPAKELPVSGDTTCVFSPDGRWLVTASAQEYRFWAVPSWQPARTLPRDRACDVAGLMAFSPDGRILATLHGRSTGVKLISVVDGQELDSGGRYLSDSSYMQSQAGKVPRCSFRIQTSLLFVVPRSGGTASK